jgi:four helix bundle protein
MELAVAAYLAANKFPSSERFGLAAHIKKSATSVPSNIAEGHAQRGDRVFLRHIRMHSGRWANSTRNSNWLGDST